MAFAIALLWKSTLLLALAFAASRLLAGRSAALRHTVWTCAAVALLALPLAQALAPPLPAPLPRLPHRAATPVVTERIVGVTLHAPTGVRAPEPAAARVAPARQAFDPIALAFAFWAGGALIVVTGLVAGRVARTRLTRGARTLDDATWIADAREIARSLVVRRKLRLLLAEDGATPMTWGTLRPTVLLPASALQWPAEQRRAFLMHELGHVARFDCAIQDLAELACAFYWMHPGAWYAAHRLRVEREQACDDLVLAHGAEADAYAGQLLAVVRASRVTRVLPGAAMAAPSQLESRVRALLDGGRDRRRVGRGGAIVAAGLACALLLPIAAVVPAASKTARKAEAPVGGSLDARWEQARREEKPTWFAYALEVDLVEKDELLVSDSEGWDEDDLAKGDLTLADRFSCAPDDAVILFHLVNGRFDRVAIRSARLAPPKGGMIAVGTIPAAESFAFLEARLAETPDDDRRAAVIVNALALHPSERAVPFLVELLDGRRGGEVRAQTAEGLGRHPTQPSLEALVAHANADRAIGVRREAAESIGDLKMPEATKPLIELALGSDERLVRQEAVESLGAREPERVVAALVKIAREDPDEMIRREAVETLGDLQGPEGLQALRVLSRSEDPAVRDEVAETLHDMAERAQKH